MYWPPLEVARFNAMGWSGSAIFQATSAIATIIRNLRAVWRRLPIPYAVRAKVSPYYGIILDKITRLRRRKPLALSLIEPGPVIVSAFFSDVTGIGRAGRLTAAKLAEWGVPVLTHDLRKDPSADLLHARHLPQGGVWMCHCNPPQVLESLANGTDPLWATRYRIGYWAYELEELPRDWIAMIPYFHEIWAPSEFVAKAIRRGRGMGKTVVRVVPHPLPDLSGATRNRTLVGFEDRFVFCAMFDARSSFARKNPMGALKAFQSAFTRDDKRVALVIKVVESSNDPASLKKLVAEASNWPNIRIFSNHLTDTEALQLIASIDCLVSLHRSEGFGLTIAEAMAVGTPVIATNWSGNVEFSADGVMAIPYELVLTDDPSGRYAQTGARWAEPSILEAAEAMRKVFGDKQMRDALIERGKQLIVERLDRPFPSEPYEQFIARKAYVRLPPNAQGVAAQQPD